MEARQRFLELHCGPSSCAASSSSLPLVSSSNGVFRVSVTMNEVPPPPPPPLPHFLLPAHDEEEEIPSWVTDYERAAAISATPIEEEDEIPSWATDFGKALAVQVISTTSQLSPSTLLQVEEDDDYNHYWAMQTMAPARLPPPPPVLVMGSDTATSLGQPPSSPRVNSPDSFHSCASIKAKDEEDLFQAAVENFAVVTPLPRFPVDQTKLDVASLAADLDAQVDTDYFTDDDLVDESSSSDEEPMDCIAPADRFLTLDRGVHEWHIDHPNDPRDLRAPFL
eukprot:5145263-Amphidinium_carterae.1